jgi:anti-sigma regulatory factor (Ser/Thr protein kinase)/N-acetylglutamate synthase-like GNAT family acetyltransferase
MENSIVLKIPNDMSYFELVEDTIHKLASQIYFSKEDEKAMVDATKELVENSITHAYKEHTGFIEILFHTFEYGLRIDVRDWGLPMSPKKQTAVPINLKEDKGFNRVYNLSDKFEYLNLGKEGKKFTIFKYSSNPVFPKPTNSKSYKEESKQSNIKQVKVEIRNFQDGDEEEIARLIYKNYGHSYVKDLFYYPKKILEYHGRKFFSIVALVDDEIVGHFALMKMPKSNIAEIGIVVVSPKYKGLGIMNKMFDKLIKRAKKLNLDAIFGEAMMYHTFSQKSNLSHGFVESAILIGKVPAVVDIEQNLLTKSFLRGSLLIGYKIFNYQTKKLNIPKIYHNQIVKTYQNANLDFYSSSKTQNIKQHTHLQYEYDPLSEISTIVINSYGKHFEHKFADIQQQLRAKHCHMIYADICLEDNPKIDKIINILNKRGFFYSGVLFLRYKNRDYLRVQNKHSDIIGKKNIQCYDKFCQSLLDFIETDEKRVKKL